MQNVVILLNYYKLITYNINLNINMCYDLRHCILFQGVLLFCNKGKQKYKYSVILTKLKFFFF